MTNYYFPNDLPNYFADAEACYKDADIVLFSICYDKSSSFRPGSRFGPDEIRKASWNFEPYNILTKKSLKNCKVHDYGNILIEDDDSIEHIFQKVKDLSHQIVTDGKIPVLIGGEHTFSAACIQSFPKDIHSIVFDAHLDFRNTYIDQKYNHACTIRRIHDHLPSDQLFILGARSGSKKEYEDIIESGVHLYTSKDIQKRSIEDIFNEMKMIIGKNKVYISIDIDVLDPNYAPGTGTLEPYGLCPSDIKQVIDVFSQQICGLDLMEVAPVYDKGQTAILSAKIIRDFIEKNIF